VRRFCVLMLAVTLLPTLSSAQSARTPDGLVVAVARSYEDMRPDLHAALFAPDYRFYFAPEDVEISPDGQGYWARADELGSAYAMLTGQTGRTREGFDLPPVRALRVELLPQDGVWTDAGDFLKEYSGLKMRRYALQATIEYEGTDFINEVSSVQRLIVRDVEGSDAQFVAWYEAGQAQSLKASAIQSWGEAKSQYGSLSPFVPVSPLSVGPLKATWRD